MPIYEYHCKKCDRTYEEIQSSYAEKTIDCPECGGLAEKVLSVSAKGTNNKSNFGSSCDKCPIPELVQVIEIANSLGFGIQIQRENVAGRIPRPSLN
ncbi:zinc ribbon domain-containing protein [Candidatus Pacearchaeota archaeon]|nr:zinc ribbon domain-containing protein [Candidatus Pacearchaeota archaeon]